MNTAWDHVKKSIESEIPSNSFSLWINPLTYLDNTDSSIVLSCPNKFSKKWVTENYLNLIRDELHELGHKDIQIVLKVEPKKPDDSKPSSYHPDQLPLPNIPVKRKPDRISFNRDYVFDRFIVGNSNEFAYSASRAMAFGNACNYHSLLMLASTGLGKTHLSQAIGNTILHHNPEARVYYITAEDFTNEMINSLKSNRIEEFKNRYRRSCDVLLLEEVHFLSGKDKIQTELGYTLDALANDRKKIIFTSSVPPGDIPDISRELSSRLTSGLVTTIGKPNYDTRVKIFTKKSSDMNLVLSEEIIHFLAGSLTPDIRQMESALNCLKAKSELLNEKINLDLAKDVVSSLVSSQHSTSTEDIKNIVCRYFKIDPSVLQSRSRKAAYAYPRNIYVYLCRKHTDETLENIAKTINRSHSSVIYASELIGHKMKSDTRLMHQVNFLSKNVQELVK